MFDQKTWPALKADLEVAGRETDDNRLESLIYEAVRAVDSEAHLLGHAISQAQDELDRSAARLAEFTGGKFASVGVNSLGILQGRNGEMDRHAALLSAALENAFRVARLAGVDAKSEVVA